MTPRTLIGWTILAAVACIPLAGCSQGPKHYADIQHLKQVEQLRQYDKMAVPDDWAWKNAHIPRYTLRTETGHYRRVVGPDEVAKARH